MNRMRIYSACSRALITRQQALPGNPIDDTGGYECQDAEAWGRRFKGLVRRLYLLCLSHSNSCSSVSN